MDEYRVIITPRAGKDIERIHAYILRDSPQNADAMIRHLLDAMEGLRQFPRRMIVVPQRNGLRELVRSLPVWPHVIYFRLTESRHLVEILHVRHGAQRPPKRFT